MPETKYASLATKALPITVKTWFIIAFIGQIFFATYILLLYGRAGLGGDFQKWNEVTSHGYVSGDPMGNVAFGFHVMLAAIITICGPLQLIPMIRQKFTKFHRVSGRIYIGCSFLISAFGLFLVWSRGSSGGFLSQIFISTNAFIIMIAAYFTIRYAMQRKLIIHRQWAIRLFIGMCGVWFFRVFLMAWILLNQGPKWFDPETFTGPFLTFLSFSVYIFPQVIVSFYFKAQETSNTSIKSAFTAFMALLILYTAIGIVGAGMMLWLPNMGG